MPSKVSELVRNLVDDIDGKYHEHSDYIAEKGLSNKNKLKEDDIVIYTH